MERLKNSIPLNWGLMANPTNWAIVTLMILIAGFGVALIFGQDDGEAA